jgi:16S rRNA (adenine1518-N6/adenine1519-N6)-dimethyltransferase
MVAAPRSKDYGSLSVWVQCQCRVEIVRLLPPTVFWPRPKVHSAIVQIELDPALRGCIRDLGWFHDFVRIVFRHRRKFLRGVLAAGFAALEKSDADELLETLGLPAGVRAEELDVQTLLALSDLVQSRLAGADRAT